GAVDVDGVAHAFVSLLGFGMVANRRSQLLIHQPPRSAPLMSSARTNPQSGHSSPLLVVHLHDAGAGVAREEPVGAPAVAAGAVDDGRAGRWAGLPKALNKVTKGGLVGVVVAHPRTLPTTPQPVNHPIPNEYHLHSEWGC